MSKETLLDILPDCDLCSKEAVYDARTKMGYWAFLCEDDFKTYGKGLGTGLGQRLRRISDERRDRKTDERE